MSNAEQRILANNHSESEKNQIMKRMTAFVEHVCSMLGGAFFAGAFAFSIVATSPAAIAFTFTTIDVPGVTGTSADRINAQGQIVGGYGDASGVDHGFLLDNGTFITIDVPGATGTGAFGINAAGQIVGAYGDAGGPSMVFC